ncbi:MAG: hypothetical protein K6T86_15305 [Pirellulales bacterium]|nr:hypothetical protein [Pirellulales bacterium]
MFIPAAFLTSAACSGKHGWWYYYLYGFLVKTSLGVLLLVPVALVLRLRRGVEASWHDELLVLAPALAMLAADALRL